MSRARARMRILMTGHAGYIGTPMVPMLLAAGHDVVGLDSGLVDFGEIQHVLPVFKPRWTAGRGAQELLEAYRKFGLAVEDYEGPRYKRIDHLKRLLAEDRLDQSLRWRTRRNVT
jgi:NAD dependent epimerase/dehydratase family